MHMTFCCNFAAFIPGKSCVVSHPIIYQSISWACVKSKNFILVGANPCHISNATDIYDS